jgi:hypothetical protein
VSVEPAFVSCLLFFGGSPFTGKSTFFHHYLNITGNS